MHNWYKKEGFEISDMDTGGATQYFGFVDAVGNWYIIQMSGPPVSAVRYARGDSNMNPYIPNWTNRATLTYDYFYNVFTV